MRAGLAGTQLQPHYTCPARVFVRIHSCRVDGVTATRIGSLATRIGGGGRPRARHRDRVACGRRSVFGGNRNFGTVKLTDLVSNQRLGHSLSC